MNETVKRNRNILIALTPEMFVRLKAIADRTGVKSATLAALAIGEMVGRLEAPDRAIRATTEMIEAHFQRHLEMQEMQEADGSAGAVRAGCVGGVAPSLRVGR